jgi:hypothetical protein
VLMTSTGAPDSIVSGVFKRRSPSEWLESKGKESPRRSLGRIVGTLH